MAFSPWQHFVTDETGAIDPTAVVTVRLESSGALATIYSDAAGSIKGNDFTVSIDGLARFYAAGGDYKIVINEGLPTEVSFRNVKIGEAAGLDKVDVIRKADTLTALKTYTGQSDGQAVEITTTGRAGLFRWTLGDFSAEVAADTQEGVYAVGSGVAATFGAWVRQHGQAVTINPVVKTTWFGAVADSGTTDNSPIVQAAIDFVGMTGGGRVHTPAAANDGDYWLDSASVDEACVWVNYDNITLSGDGAASLYKTTNNAHVPFHFSSEQDLTVQAGGTELTNFEVYGIHVKGTGVYQNFVLAKGRGILFRNVKNVSVHDCHVSDMSMIGIVAEGGDGYFKVESNQVHGCKYGSINYNGRCYLSLISNNICSGSDGDVNSLAIQATGPSTISFNQVYGDVLDPSVCGGISWGEGNYDGIGGIHGNTVKHCSFGIKAVYHGSCNITGNTLINCIGQGGISLIGTTTGSFTVANSDNIAANNLIINCSPYGIDCSSEDTLFTGNKIRTFTPVTNPSASTEPDYIGTVTTQRGIRIRAEGCAVVGNYLSGCVHGLTTTILQKDGIISGNTFKNNTQNYSLESQTAGTIAASGVAIIEREQSSPDTFRERIFRASRPLQGYFDLSSEWTDPTPTIGSPVGEIVLHAKQTTAAVGEPSGETVIELTSATSWFASATATVCGIELDNGAWHWTTVTAVASPNITIGTAIPVGRTVAVGASVIYNSWRPLANVA